MGLGAIQAASCNLESPHLLSIGDRHNRGYRLTALQVQTVRRTVGLPRTLFLSRVSRSLPPLFPLLSLSPWDAANLRRSSHWYSCVGSSESIHTLSQVHVLRGTLLLLMFIRWATGRCKTGTAMLSQVTSWYIIISCLLHDVRATTFPSGTRKIELSCPCRWYAQRVRPSARL